MKIIKRIIKNWNCSIVRDGYLYSSNLDKIEITCIRTNKTISILEHLNNVTAFILSEKYLISGDYDGFISIWNLSNLKLEITLKKHNTFVSRLYINKDYLIALQCNSVNIWSLKTFKLHRKINLWEYSSPKIVCNKKYFFTIYNNTIQKCSFQKLTGIDFITTTHPVVCMAISDDYLCTGCSDGAIRVYSLENQKLKTLCQHSSSIISMVVSNGRLYSSDFNHIKIWDLNTFQEIITIDSTAEGHYLTFDNYLYLHAKNFFSKRSYINVYSNDEMSLNREFSLLNQYINIYQDNLINTCLECFLA
jgi:WD40 repeat protein